MANMSYCRFHNTLRDLQDCKDAILEGGTLSAEEYKAYRKLVRVCTDIVQLDDEFPLDGPE